MKNACTKILCDYWHLPRCQFYKTETGCKFDVECVFPHWNVEEQPNKRLKKDDDKSAVAIVKSVQQLGCVSQDVEPSDSVTISWEGPKGLRPSRRVRFTRVALRHPNIRESKGPSLKKYKSKVLISAVLTSWNLRTDLRKSQKNVSLISFGSSWWYPPSKWRKESLWWTLEQACMRMLILSNWKRWRLNVRRWR